MRTQLITTTLLSFILLFSLITISQIDTATAQNTIYVKNEGADFTSIQNAINNATEGDTIYVYSGTYYENITINKTITLIGENKNTTIIDAEGKENAVNITADYVNMSGFTVTNCGPDKGSAVIIQAKHINLSSCIITKNNFHAIHLSSNGYNTIYNNQVTDNIGKGITASSTVYNKILNNTIIGNECGICPCASEYNTITGNHLENNQYGLYMCNTADNNLIYHNSIINSTGQQSFDMHKSQWYNSSIKQGNYWSDYEGFDNNDDNIGDTPYSIYGGENKDLYPLMKPYTYSLYKKNTTPSEEICILIFYSPLCGPCEENLEHIEKLSENYTLAIEKHNILKEEELALLNQYFEAYGISEENQDTFCVFISDKYFHTEEEVNTELEQEIQKHVTTGCDCPSNSDDISNNSDESLNIIIVIVVIITGLIIGSVILYTLKRGKNKTR